MVLHKPQFKLMDLIILIAFLSVIFAAFSHLPAARLAFAGIVIYQFFLNSFFGPLTKTECAIFVVMPAFLIILLLPICFASRRSACNPPAPSTTIGPVFCRI